MIHFTHKLQDTKEGVMLATFEQIGRIMEDRHGISLKHPPQIERLKSLYITRPDKPATRFELAVQTSTGRRGVPSAFQLTGLLQLLPPDIAG